MRLIKKVHAYDVYFCLTFFKPFSTMNYCKNNSKTNIIEIAK